jgi:signal transduction histidine kinase/PAS domain-containing protein
MAPLRLALAARLRAIATDARRGFLRVWRAGWQWLGVHTFLPMWLPARWRHPITGYVVAVVLMFLAAIGTWVLLQDFPRFAFVGSLPLLIVMFLAFTFGAGPSLFGTVVGAVFLYYFTLTPYMTWQLGQPESVIGVAVHVIVGVSVSILASRVEQARQQADDERMVARRLSARLQATLDVLPVGVAIAGASGELELTNRAFQGVWGVLEPSMLPSDADRVCLGWRLDGSPIAAHEWGLARAMRNGVSVLNEEIEIADITGERKSVLYSAAPIHNAQGMVDGGVVVMLDITARRKLERRTHAALTTLLAMAETLVAPPPSPEAIPATTTTPMMLAEAWERTRERSAIQQVLSLTQHLFGGQYASAMLIAEDHEAIEPIAVVGLAPAEEQRWWVVMRQAVVSDFTPPFDRARLYAEELSAIRIESEPLTIPGQNAFGQNGAMLASLRLAAGRMCLVVMEVAERVELTAQDFELAMATARLVGSLVEQERLLREREEARATVLALEETNRRMDEFLGIVSHELRTPLTSAKLSAQMAGRWLHQWVAAPAEEPAGAVKPERLTKLLALITQINRQIARQERLVNDLLDVSRMHAGHLELRMVPCDVVAVVREAVEEQRLLHPGREITFAVRPDGEPMIVEGDADRIGQAATNYLTNALKYSPERAPVRVHLDADERKACLCVQDEGPGIPVEEQERLWDRFYRVSDVVVQSGSGVGLGLGLYITRTIIERLGGQVGVRSRPGDGTTFWLALPLLQPESSFS